MAVSECVNSLNLYSVFYDEEGYRELKEVECISFNTKDDIIINLIGKGYLEPQALPFVEVIELKNPKTYNVINTTTNALLFRIE